MTEGARDIQRQRGQGQLWAGGTRNRPGELAPVVRVRDGELELVELAWGLKPAKAGGRPVINIRSEGRTFSRRRCLVPADEFVLGDPVDHRTRWRFKLAGGESFYLAGLWSPAREDWPEALALLTTAANPDVAPVNDRQPAVIPRAARLDWLNALLPAAEVLWPLPPGSYRGERISFLV